MSRKTVDPDAVDIVMENWGRERPDLDPTAVEVGNRIERLATRLRGRAVDALAPFGLGPPGYAVLAALRRAGEPFELTPTELSRATLLTSGAMTNRIDRLEQAGLVERRRPGGGDRRSIRIGLTARGRELEAIATTASFAAAERAANALGPSERDRLRALLRKLEAGFGEDTEVGAATA